MSCMLRSGVLEEGKLGTRPRGDVRSGPCEGLPSQSHFQCPPIPGPPPPAPRAGNDHHLFSVRLLLCAHLCQVLGEPTPDKISSPGGEWMLSFLKDRPLGRWPEYREGQLSRLLL